MLIITEYSYQSLKNQTRLKVGFYSATTAKFMDIQENIVISSLGASCVGRIVLQKTTLKVHKNALFSKVTT